MNKFVIFDIDGTISDCSARSDLGKDRSWAEFHAAAIDDPTIETMCELIDVFNDAGNNIILLTGRPEKYRNMTEDWLSTHALSHLITEIIMRPDDDFSPAGPLKLKLLIERFETEEIMKDNIWFIVEDNDKIIETLRGAGLVVMQPSVSQY